MDALYVVALLACPVGMGLMMWLMMRSRRGDGRDGGRGDGRGDGEQSTAQHTEIQRLRDELEELRQVQQGRENSRVERG